MRITEKKKVIEALCNITRSLGGKLYRITRETYARDCFCGIMDNDSCFQFDDFIIEFVRQAVDEKLKLLLPIEERKI